MNAGGYWNQSKQTFDRKINSKLYEKAKTEFGADDVINLSLDYEQASYGIFYNKRVYIMSGLAIKYKK